MLNNNIQEKELSKFYLNPNIFKGFEDNYSTFFDSPHEGKKSLIENFLEIVEGEIGRSIVNYEHLFSGKDQFHAEFAEKVILKIMENEKDRRLLKNKIDLAIKGRDDILKELKKEVEYTLSLMLKEPKEDQIVKASSNSKETLFVYKQDKKWCFRNNARIKRDVKQGEITNQEVLNAINEKISNETPIIDDKNDPRNNQYRLDEVIIHELKTELSKDTSYQNLLESFMLQRCKAICSYAYICNYFKDVINYEHSKLKQIKEIKKQDDIKKDDKTEIKAMKEVINTAMTNQKVELKNLLIKNNFDDNSSSLNINKIKENINNIKDYYWGELICESKGSLKSLAGLAGRVKMQMFKDSLKDQGINNEELQNYILASLIQNTQIDTGTNECIKVNNKMLKLSIFFDVSSKIIAYFMEKKDIIGLTLNDGGDEEDFSIEIKLDEENQNVKILVRFPVIETFEYNTKPKIGYISFSWIISQTDFYDYAPKIENIILEVDESAKILTTTIGIQEIGKLLKYIEPWIPLLKHLNCSGNSELKKCIESIIKNSSLNRLKGNIIRVLQKHHQCPSVQELANLALEHNSEPLAIAVLRLGVRRRRKSLIRRIADWFKGVRPGANKLSSEVIKDLAIKFKDNENVLKEIFKKHGLRRRCLANSLKEIHLIDLNAEVQNNLNTKLKGFLTKSKLDFLPTAVVCWDFDGTLALLVSDQNQDDINQDDIGKMWIPNQDLVKGVLKILKNNGVKSICALQRITYDEGYDLQLMSDEVEIKANSLYVKKTDDGELQYTVITPKKEKITANITVNDLKNEELKKGLSEAEAEDLLTKLRPYLNDILEITSKKGHTHDENISDDNFSKYYAFQMIRNAGLGKYIDLGLSDEIGKSNKNEKTGKSKNCFLNGVKERIFGKVNVGSYNKKIILFDDHLGYKEPTEKRYALNLMSEEQQNLEQSEITSTKAVFVCKKAEKWFVCSKNKKEGEITLEVAVNALNKAIDGKIAENGQYTLNKEEISKLKESLSLSNDTSYQNHTHEKVGYTFVHANTNNKENTKTWNKLHLQSLYNLLCAAIQDKKAVCKGINKYVPKKFKEQMKNYITSGSMGMPDNMDIPFSESDDVQLEFKGLRTNSSTSSGNNVGSVNNTIKIKTEEEEALKVIHKLGGQETRCAAGPINSIVFKNKNFHKLPRKYKIPFLGKGLFARKLMPSLQTIFKDGAKLIGGDKKTRLKIINRALDERYLLKFDVVHGETEERLHDRMKKLEAKLEAKLERKRQKWGTGTNYKDIIEMKNFNKPSSTDIYLPTTQPNLGRGQPTQQEGQQPTDNNERPESESPVTPSGAPA